MTDEQREELEGLRAYCQVQAEFSEKNVDGLRRNGHPPGEFARHQSKAARFRRCVAALDAVLAPADEPCVLGHATLED